MILLPQGRKILIIAASLFIATFSMVLFVVSGDQPGHGANLKTSLFEEFLNHDAAATGETADEPPKITLDAHGAILDTNEAFSTHFGYALKDLRGKSFFTVITSEDLPHFAGDYSAAVSSKTIVVNSGPYHLVSDDNAQHLVLITYTPHSKSGQSGITLTLKDISNSVDTKAGEKIPKGKTIKEHETKKDEGTREKNRIIVEKTG